MDGWMDASLAGVDTKIMRNCGKIHLKRTKMDQLMNKLVILVSRPEPLLLGVCGAWEGGGRGGLSTDRGPSCHFSVLGFPPLQMREPDPTDGGLWARESYSPDIFKKS